jgi:sulfur transfer complex TusBCD TusB component (DsrH family)
MEHYLLIESRDPFESNDVPYYYELSKDLAEAGNDVTLYLVQNGVLATRASAHSGLSSLAETGVKVLADDFSLEERGIGKLADGIVAASIETVVDLLAAGHKTLWH